MRYKKIECIKNDKSLVELQAMLFYATEKEEARLLSAKSKIKVYLSDYSNGKGDKNVIVSANISPEECQQIYEDAKVYYHFGIKNPYEFQRLKIFGSYKDPEGNSTGEKIVTKIVIRRTMVDKQGNRMRNPWNITIENGKGKSQEDKNQLVAGTYECISKVSKQISDLDMIRLFRRANNLISAAEVNSFHTHKNQLIYSLNSNE